VGGWKSGARDHERERQLGEDINPAVSWGGREVESEEKKKKVTKRRTIRELGKTVCAFEPGESASPTPLKLSIKELAESS